MKSIPLQESEVQSLLQDGKATLRRVVKPQPPEDWGGPIAVEFYHPAIDGKDGMMRDGPEIFGAYSEDWGVACPFGGPGQRLLVREACTIVEDRNTPCQDSMFWATVKYKADGLVRHEMVVQEAWRESFAPPGNGYRTSTQMPVWASRLTIEIVSVRVEQAEAWEWVIGVKLV